MVIEAITKRARGIFDDQQCSAAIASAPIGRQADGAYITEDVVPVIVLHGVQVVRRVRLVYDARNKGIAELISAEEPVVWPRVAPSVLKIFI